MLHLNEWMQFAIIIAVATRGGEVEEVEEDEKNLGRKDDTRQRIDLIRGVDQLSAEETGRKAETRSAIHPETELKTGAFVFSNPTSQNRQNAS